MCSRAELKGDDSREGNILRTYPRLGGKQWAMYLRCVTEAIHLMDLLYEVNNVHAIAFELLVVMSWEL